RLARQPGDGDKGGRSAGHNWPLVSPGRPGLVDWGSQENESTAASESPQGKPFFCGERAASQCGEPPKKGGAFRRSSIATREYRPCFQFARLLRARPSGVRRSVLLPPLSKSPGSLRCAFDVR